MAIVPRLRSAAEIIFSLYTAKKTKTRCAQTVDFFSCFFVLYYFSINVYLRYTDCNFLWKYLLIYSYYAMILSIVEILGECLWR